MKCHWAGVAESRRPSPWASQASTRCAAGARKRRFAAVVGVASPATAILMPTVYRDVRQSHDGLQTLMKPIVLASGILAGGQHRPVLHPRIRKDGRSGGCRMSLLQLAWRTSGNGLRAGS